MEFKQALELAKIKGLPHWDGLTDYELSDEGKYLELCFIQKYIRDNYKTDISVSFDSYSPDKPAYIAVVKSLSSKNMGEILLHGFTYFPQYEKALLQGIIEVLKAI